MKKVVLVAALVVTAALILPSVAELGMAQDQTGSSADALFSAGDQEGGLEGFLQSLTQDTSSSSARSVSSAAAVSSAADASASSETVTGDDGVSSDLTDEDGTSSGEVLPASGTETGTTPEGLPDTGLGGMAE
ncbi:MAG: hypothetical protein WCV62_06660 [Candidatus Peribacteraceae bacterium]|jgi:hypothetical protein